MNTYMKGCYFFYGDITNNSCTWSKNSIDCFDIASSQEHAQSFWESIIYPNDFYLFEKLLTGRKNQISGDFRFKTKDGTWQWMQCVAQLEEKNNKRFYSGVLTDLTFGYSTKAVSRFREETGFRTILESVSLEHRAYGILIIGIDDFENVNELYSYALGDEILRRFAKGVEKLLPENASLYQLNSDDFGVLYPDATLDDMKDCFQQIQKIAQPIMAYEDMSVFFTVTGGICMYPENGQDGETLYRNARVAFNEAKYRGMDQFIVYNEEISQSTSFQAKLMEALRESVIHDFKGFKLSYQPLVYADDGGLYGCEALLRWQHPDFPKRVSPVEFIPLLEKSKLIIPIGNWIIDQALKQKKQWDQHHPRLQMNINVAADQFREDSFTGFVMSKIHEYGIDPSTITLELTESGEIKDTDKINDVFSFFRSQRLKIALDDFGTGYDSLNCLRLLSSDVLKIDRSFLDRITYNVADQKILYNIINLCKSMKMDVCIEGVETPQVKDIMKELGAGLLQGYYYSRPLTSSQFEAIMMEDIKQSASGKRGQDQYHKNLDLLKNQSLLYGEVKPTPAMDMNELVELAHAGIFQVGMDREFTFLTCNEGYRRMLGYTAKEIEEKFSNKALGFVHSDDLEYVNTEIRRQLSFGDTVTIEFRIVRKDGSPLWILGTGNVVRSAKGGASLVVVIIDNDVTKKRNLQMEADYLKYHAILSNIPAGVKCVHFDEYFTIDYISPSFLQILGYNETDIRDKFDNKYINMVYEEDVVRVMGDVMDQVKTSDVVVLRYRSYCKDGSLIWVETISKLCPPDAKGIQKWYSSVMNVTDILSDDEKHRTSSFKERYQEAAERWGDILFELDISKQYISFSGNYAETFGGNQTRKLEDLLLDIHEEDRNHFIETIAIVQKEKKIQRIEIRIQNSQHDFIWCALAFNEPDCIKDKPVMLMGKINIIDTVKKEINELIQKSEADPLTGLLNKGALENRIRTLINEERDHSYALIMLDVDDFKYVNDTFGHLYGDKLLKEFGHRIANLFDYQCVLGRAGGDEFIMFVPIQGDMEEVQTIANQLLKRMNQEFCYDKITYLPKVSIGVSCFPIDGDNFYDLYRNADSALYRIKLRNKNDICIFSL